MKKMQTPLPVETRRRMYETDPKWIFKTILRLVTTFCALLSLALFAAATHLTNLNFINLAGDGDWTDGMAIAPV